MHLTGWEFFHQSWNRQFLPSNLLKCSKCFVVVLGSFSQNFPWKYGCNSSISLCAWLESDSYCSDYLVSSRYLNHPSDYPATQATPPPPHVLAKSYPHSPTWRTRCCSESVLCSVTCPTWLDRPGRAVSWLCISYWMQSTHPYSLWNFRNYLWMIKRQFHAQQIYLSRIIPNVTNKLNELRKTVID